LWSIRRCGVSGHFLFFCYPLILHAVYGVVLFFAFGLWYFHLRTNNLRYRLDGSALYVDGGILFPSRKLIPLERVTEIASYQGPLLLCFGIWTLQIQTTESPHRGEATLIGVRDPERVRDLILSRRQSVYGKKSEDA